MAEEGEGAVYIKIKIVTTEIDCRRNKVLIKLMNQSKVISQSCWSDYVWQLVGLNILWLLGAI